MRIFFFYHPNLLVSVSSQNCGERWVHDFLEISSAADVMFYIFSAIDLFASLSLAFSPLIHGEAEDDRQELGSQKANTHQRQDFLDSYRV